MITVNVVRAYDYPDFFRQTPAAQGLWEDVKFLLNTDQDCDLLICLNPPKHPIHTKIPLERRWLFTQEPPVEQNNWHLKCFPYFGNVFSQFAGDNLNCTQTALPWHVQKNYDELVSIKNISKSKTLSTITSNLSNLEGHYKRVEFLSYLQDAGMTFDFFGKGRNYILKKEDGLLPYKYSICIENSVYPHYWTEKIADCFLCYTMPIYFGCPNISEYFPKDSYLQLDLSDFEKSKELIIEAIEGKYWEKNFEKIVEARNLILHNYQFFPWVKKLIRLHLSFNSPKTGYSETIPPFHSPKMGTKEAIKHFVENAKKIIHNHLHS